MHDVLIEIKGKLVVSCQALQHEPLHSSYIMGRMAIAAREGGASAIRANSKADIKEIKGNIELPVIGIVKRDYPDSDVYITATMREIKELAQAGTEMIAMDATKQSRPEGETLEGLVEKTRRAYPDVALMADVSTTGEAIQAERLGFDCISTTLVGYTSYTEGQRTADDDFAILKDILANVSTPVIAEGKMDTPELAKAALDAGAFSVVVGGAITRPQQITKMFVNQLNK
ncbi:N-acetylmannosamine-6-phosphate 2-epimerase [Shouchella shacheensis]|uniref:N-acetylmannosamine-6-phosphate 2-epimerase n=1 Tax=Shouchella shacheensis TaxID=1649580 RepID=UPI00074026F1|nr:N-acetylmannosamine-6-phosphate 2-epimerase [Shouchella shacheensis]